jgi:transcriptional regulator with XRE-family HTH domain
MVSADGRGTHTDTPALPFCNLKLKSPKPIDRAYPTELRTIGDHVRKRRLDLGQLQRDVALRIGVDKTTVFNWESGTASPNLRAIPGVVRFLGYDPTETGSALGERLRAARRRLGISHADLARRLGVDPTTVLDWEIGRHRPSRRYRQSIDEFLAGGWTEEVGGAAVSHRSQATRR